MNLNQTINMQRKFNCFKFFEKKYNKHWLINVTFQIAILKKLPVRKGKLFKQKFNDISPNALESSHVRILDIMKSFSCRESQNSNAATGTEDYQISN